MVFDFNFKCSLWHIFKAKTERKIAKSRDIEEFLLAQIDFHALKGGSLC
jgi:hypothetical protein